MARTKQTSTYGRPSRKELCTKAAAERNNPRFLLRKIRARGADCGDDSVETNDLLSEVCNFFVYYKVLKVIRFLMLLYNAMLHPIARQVIREVVCLRADVSEVVEYLLETQHDALEKMVAKQKGIDLVTDLAVSSAIAWSSDHTISEARLMQKLCSAPRLIANYLPLKDMALALHLIVDSLHHHCSHLVPKLTQAMVHQLIKKRSKNEHKPVSVKAEEAAVVALHLSFEKNSDGTLKPLSLRQMEQLVLATSEPFLQAKVALAWVSLSPESKWVKDKLFALAMQSQGAFKEQWKDFIADAGLHYKMAVMEIIKASKKVVKKFPYTANFLPDRSTKADHPGKDMYRKQFVIQLWKIISDNESSDETLGGFRPRYGRETSDEAAVPRSSSPVAGPSGMQAPKAIISAEKTPKKKASPLKATPLRRPFKNALNQKKKKSAAKWTIVFSDEPAAADSDASDAQPSSSFADMRLENTLTSAHLRDAVRAVQMESGAEAHTLTKVLTFIKELESAPMYGRKRPASIEKPIHILVRLTDKDIVVPKSMKPRVVLKRLSDADIQQMLHSSVQPQSPQMPDPSTPTEPIAAMPAASATALVGPIVPSSNSNSGSSATQQSARLKARKKPALVPVLSMPAAPLVQLAAVPQVHAQAAKQPQLSTPPAAVLQIPSQKITVVAEVHHLPSNAVNPSSKKIAAKRKAQMDTISNKKGSKKAAVAVAAAPATPIVAPPTDGALQQPLITKARKSGILTESQRRLLHDYATSRIVEIARPQDKDSSIVASADSSESATPESTDLEGSDQSQKEPCSSDAQQSPVTKATSSGMFAFCIKFLSWFGFATRQEVKDDNFVKTADKKVDEESAENSVDRSAKGIDHSSDGDEDKEEDASGSKLNALSSKANLADQPFGRVTDNDDEINVFLTEDEDEHSSTQQVIKLNALSSVSSHNKAASSCAKSRPSRSRKRQLPYDRRPPASSKCEASKPVASTKRVVPSRKRIFMLPDSSTESSEDLDTAHLQQSSSRSSTNSTTLKTPAPQRCRVPLLVSSSDSNVPSSQRRKKKVASRSSLAGTSSRKRQRVSSDSDSDEPELSKRRRAAVALILLKTAELKATFAGLDN